MILFSISLYILIYLKAIYSYTEIANFVTLNTIRNERRDAIDRDEGVGSSTSSPVNEKVDELPTASNAGLDRQIKDALHRQDLRGNGRQLSTVLPSVLPRPFLQGAAPCPLFVTPCPF